MMFKITSIALCCFFSFVVSVQVPDLPQSFAGDAQVTLPFIGQVQGYMYYDYPNSRYRVDMNQFGSTYISLYRYDLGYSYQISGSPGSYQCEAQTLEDELYPMDIPPYAQYNGMQTVNGEDCQEFDLSLGGMIELSFFVTNITDADGKQTPVLVEFNANAGGQITTFDFSNVVPGPQADSLFDPSVFNCPRPVPPKTYTLSGYVKSATTTSPISGATVYVGGQSTSTNSNGQYTITDIPGGTYSLKASASGYFNSMINLTIDNDINAGTVADFNLSPTLNQNQYRIVLTWGQFPADLDAHLNTPWSCNVYYANKYCSSSSSSASLDVDDQNGYGPETVTLYTPSSFSGSFTFFVYQYTTAGSLLTSNGRVQVYGSTGLLYDLKVPTSGYPDSSRTWNVFTLAYNGQFTIQNTLSA